MKFKSIEVRHNFRTHALEVFCIFEGEDGKQCYIAFAWSSLSEKSRFEPLWATRAAALTDVSEFDKALAYRLFSAFIPAKNEDIPLIADCPYCGTRRIVSENDISVCDDCANRIRNGEALLRRKTE